MLDRAAIGYSALGNRGLLWVAGGVVAGLATGRLWAIPLVAAVVWVTLGVNYAIKRGVRRERPLERRGRAPLIVAPATPVLPVQPRRDGRGGRGRALGLRTGPDPAVRYPGRPDGCLARSTSAVHHVSDVVAGLAVGACTGAAFALLAA